MSPNKRDFNTGRIGVAAFTPVHGAAKRESARGRGPCAGSHKVAPETLTPHVRAGWALTGKNMSISA
jgi:hypothetical protein